MINILNNKNLIKYIENNAIKEIALFCCAFILLFVLCLYFLIYIC